MLVYRKTIAIAFFGITLLSLFQLNCYGQLTAPTVKTEIVSIEGVDYLLIEWERVEDAKFYKIYSSKNPFSEAWGEPIATVGDSIFSYREEVDGESMNFFYITAAVQDDGMVLVDGDLFQGEVLIDPFYLSKYLVTQEQYTVVMGVNPSHFADAEGRPFAPNLPVECVSWFDAVEFCNRLSMSVGLTPAFSYRDLGTDPDNWYRVDDRWNAETQNHQHVFCDWEANGYRLPTEAEWNHAADDARFPTRYAYAGSDNIDEVAWWLENADERTHPVGTKAPNGLNIYDLSGNVVEWCWDQFGSEFPSGGDNPRGPIQSPNRMGRGGSWQTDAERCTNDYRIYGLGRSDYTTRRSEWLGFRLARNRQE